MAKNDKEIIEEFHAVVNMKAKDLDSWLNTEQSQEVGQKRGSSESTGHESGRHIIQLLNKKESEYDEDDLSHMKKVVGYVHRHLAQKPSGDIKDTRWRYSLMNWGHDPLKN